MTPATHALWQRYHETGDIAIRTELLAMHVGLVHHIARDVAMRLPGAVELDDLVSSGMLGLVRAVESFDTARGLEFSTYATPRVRGAMLDELRAFDWVPRGVRQRRRQIASATDSIERRTGRAATAPQLAEALGVDRDTLWRWQRDADLATMVPLDAPDGERAERLAQRLVHTETPAPGDRLDAEDRITVLSQALAELSDKERTVLALYYYEQLTLREIGAVLHVTESRVSQIRTAALQRLRERLTPVRDTL
jgi:RNA polymerase sigma factor for flagellar operon FliA